jgi:DNA-directed RNA polymerase alpha subunit
MEVIMNQSLRMFLLAELIAASDNTLNNSFITDQEAYELFKTLQSFNQKIAASADYIICPKQVILNNRTIFKQKYMNIAGQFNHAAAWQDFMETMNNVRLSKRLRATGTTSFPKLVTLQTKDIASWRNIGKETLNDLHYNLFKIGLTLNMNKEEARQIFGQGCFEDE